MTDLPKPNIDWTRLARAFIRDGYLPMATGKAALDQADARHAEDQAALATLRDQMQVLMNKRIAADEARDAYAKARREVLEQAARAMCGYCAEGSPFDGDSHTDDHGAVRGLCRAYPIRALIDQED